MLRFIWSKLLVALATAAISVIVFFVAATLWWELTTSPNGIPPGW
jgi:hypothetical protein